MDMHIFVLAFIAALYTVMVLVTYHPITYLWGKYWRRTKVMHKSTQLGQSHFALTEGQTLVGVIDTTKVICFFIDHDTRDAQPYD
jgi:hypothetical protein